MPLSKQTLNPTQKLWIGAGAVLLLLKAALPVSAASLTVARSLSYTPADGSSTAFAGNAVLSLDSAANIYVVDGINNTLEVFDTSWLPLAQAQQSKAVERAASSAGKVYFLDGINSTLQVLDDRSPSTPVPVTAGAAAQSGKTYLVDEFNKTFQLSAESDGLVATSGSRNGLISPPFGEARSENFYIVDGFNNRLEISAAGNSALEGISTAQVSSFFQGPLTAEDVSLSTILPLVEQFAASGAGAEDEAAKGLIAAISAGPFAEPVDTEAGIATIIDSIGNPNRSLGWIKDLDAVSDPEGETAFLLSREVDTGPWRVSSKIQAGGEDIYLMDGFNNRLQTVLSDENSLAADEADAAPASSFSLVDGINNSLSVSNADAALWMLLSGNGERAAVEGSAGNLSLNNIFSQVYLTADSDRDYFRVNGINNSIELFDQSGSRTLINNTLNQDGTSGIAQDGYGNIYVINGINNRIRALTHTPAAVPEPSSAIALMGMTSLLMSMKYSRSRSL